MGFNNLLKIAFQQYGNKEIVGNKDNPEIIKYFRETGYRDIIHDETAWCSAVHSWICLKAGYERSAGLNAKSWLKIGRAIHTPKIGDTIVLWRGDPKSWQGHVGFFINFGRNGTVYILGGNQKNQYNISGYPISRILGYRRLQKISKTIKFKIPFIKKTIEIL